jgi:hypothetical protein
MAHIYMLFDFGADEERAQKGRHKLEGWKQAFRLDKKLLFKFDREESAASEGTGDGVKPRAKGKASIAEKPKVAERAAGSVRLMVRLDFSDHERLSFQRWVARIPLEEPFKMATPKTMALGDAQYEETAKRFEELA